MGMDMEVGLPDLNQIYIPRRRRGSSSAAVKKEQPLTQSSKPSISMLEAAVVLMAIAHSVSDVESFCNRQLQKYENTHKRKNPPIASTKKPPRKKRAKQSEFPSVPEMPAAMRERIAEMGGYEINLVIQKQLQDTDVNKNHGRLSLPAKKLLYDFATEEERKLLSKQENKNKKGMNVVIMDHLLRESNICLKKWKIGSGYVYCLMTQWNSFVEETRLKSGDHIQLWSFRKDDEFEGSHLCFAMVKLVHECV